MRARRDLPNISHDQRPLGPGLADSFNSLHPILRLIGIYRGIVFFIVVMVDNGCTLTMLCLSVTRAVHFYRTTMHHALLRKQKAFLE